MPRRLAFLTDAGGKLAHIAQKLFPKVQLFAAGWRGARHKFDVFTVGKIKRILRQAVKRARQLDVNATISILDREGNVLAVLPERFGNSIGVVLR